VKRLFAVAKAKRGRVTTLYRVGNVDPGQLRVPLIVMANARGRPNSSVAGFIYQHIFYTSYLGRHLCGSEVCVVNRELACINAAATSGSAPPPYVPP